MYDIQHLEEEWKRYNRKKKRPFVFALLFLLIVGIGIFIFFSNPDYLNLFKQEDNTSKASSIHTQIKLTTYMDPSLNKLEEKVSNKAEERSLTSQNSPLVDNTLLSSDFEDKKSSKIHIEVTEANSKSAYKEVEKRFRLGHDIDDSLFLAKAYYLRGEYKKAEYWALQTNKINDNIEESWLIFIKSKIKTGHKNEAIRILNTYIQKTNSREAKVLLQKIRK